MGWPIHVGNKATVAVDQSGGGEAKGKGTALEVVEDTH